MGSWLDQQTFLSVFVLFSYRTSCVASKILLQYLLLLLSSPGLFMNLVIIDSKMVINVTIEDRTQDSCVRSANAPCALCHLPWKRSYFQQSEPLVPGCRRGCPAEVDEAHDGFAHLEVKLHQGQLRDLTEER